MRQTACLYIINRKMVYIGDPIIKSVDLLTRFTQLYVCVCICAGRGHVVFIVLRCGGVVRFIGACGIFYNHNLGWLFINRLTDSDYLFSIFIHFFI